MELKIWSPIHRLVVRGVSDGNKCDETQSKSYVTVQVVIYTPRNNRGGAGASSARTTRDQLDSQDKRLRPTGRLAGGSSVPSPAVFGFVFCWRLSYLQLCLHRRLPLLSPREKGDEETIGLWGRGKSQMAIDPFQPTSETQLYLLRFKHWQRGEEEAPKEAVLFLENKKR